MILVDTSVWVDHLRKGNDQLKNLLVKGDVICHPYIVGELACGNLKNRAEILSLIQALPQASTIDLDEYLFFIDRFQLNGLGIGFVDINLLASAKLSDIRLWTNDKRLNQVAEKLKISF